MRGGGGGDRGDARHDDGLDRLAQPREEIHEAAIEERIALAQQGDIRALIEMARDGGAASS